MNLKIENRNGKFTVNVPKSPPNSGYNTYRLVYTYVRRPVYGKATTVCLNHEEASKLKEIIGKYVNFDIKGMYKRGMKLDVTDRQGERIGVCVALEIDNEIYYQFAKIKPPDKFNSMRGIEVAVGRILKGYFYDFTDFEELGQEHPDVVDRMWTVYNQAQRVLVATQ